MDYHVAQLLKEPIGSTRTFDLAETATPAEESNWQEIRGPVKLTRTSRGILVQADLEATYAEDCSRCVGPFTGTLEFQIEEEFYPTIDVYTGRSVTPPEDLDGFPIDSNHIVDLRPAVRQGAWLARPIAPLCRSECAGLCAECGQDLNAGPCGCRPANDDPRWAALNQLLGSPTEELNVKEGE